MKETVIQVISLVNAKSRREHIKNMFLSLNIPFQFFDAIDKNIASYQCELAKLNYLENSLTLGELGCFMSHYLLWQKMIDADLQYMVICEDDVVLSSKISLLFEVLDEIMRECDLLKFETMKMPTILSHTLSYLDSGIKIQKLENQHLGMAGYVISQNTAKRYVKMFSNIKINKPIDEVIFFDSFMSSHNIFQVNPALAIQEDVLNKENPILVSSLHKERVVRMYHKPNLNLIQKIKRESLRILQQFSSNYFKRKKLQKQLKRNSTIIEFME